MTNKLKLKTLSNTIKIKKISKTKTGIKCPENFKCKKKIISREDTSKNKTKINFFKFIMKLNKIGTNKKNIYFNFSIIFNIQS